MVHIDRDRMRGPMRRIVDRPRTVNPKAGDMDFPGMPDGAAMKAGQWEGPEPDEVAERWANAGIEVAYAASRVPVWRRPC